VGGIVVALKVSEQAYQYLVGQNGDLSHIARDRGRFLEALRLKTLKATNLIAAHSMTIDDVVESRGPSNLTRMLNIGSGIGVVEVSILQKTAAHCTMIDGEDAGPVCVKSRVPHCSRAAVAEFLRDNDVDPSRYSYHNPHDLPDRKFDVVVSFGSWCFHYPPHWYLDYVVEHLDPGGLVIVDVRARHGDWMDDLAKRLRVIDKHPTDDKHVRTVLRRVS
jgi:SAM-dependent methyltransferase